MVSEANPQEHTAHNLLFNESRYITDFKKSKQDTYTYALPHTHKPCAIKIRPNVQGPPPTLTYSDVAQELCISSACCSN